LELLDPVADAKGVVGAGEDEGAVGRRLGAASMNKKKNEPAKGRHGVGVFDLMGMASAESDGVGVEEREEKFDGSTKKKKQACGGNSEGKMVFSLYSATLKSTTITPKLFIKQPLHLFECIKSVCVYSFANFIFY
jgi:hypothetical protein